MESLVLLLACPVGMGVAMRLGTRRAQQASLAPLPDAPALSARANLREQQAARRRVVVAVALAGVFLWRLAPQLVLPAVILLLLLACPVSHYLLLRGAPGAPCHSAPQEPSGAQQARTPPAGQGEQAFGARWHAGGQRGA